MYKWLFTITRGHFKKKALLVKRKEKEKVEHIRNKKTRRKGKRGDTAGRHEERMRSNLRTR